jgi:predicted amidophosphoribosyltransferase
MARKSKCKNCSKELSKEERIVDGGKSYCENCHNDAQLEKENYKLLISTVCEYFSIDEPTGLIVKQIQQYKNEYKYTNSGIGYTLWYIKEIKGKTFSEPKYGIALVKYHYEEAKRYFDQQQRISNSIGTENQEVKTKEVKVNINKVYKKDVNKFTIDINQLLGGE